jgi:hypothetical protein
MNLSINQAKNIALDHQFYRFDKHSGKQGVLDIINTLSYIQIDTISVIERAHHHTLYNRVHDYHPDMLNDLLAKDKAIWEYWGHAASYLPLTDYPYYKFRMHSFPNGTWEKKFWELHKDMSQPILDRIRAEGPLSTRHFEDTRTVKENQVWGNIKPAKIMLELLMWKGELIVTARDKFQRVYDLTERVIPHYQDIELPSEQSRAEFMIQRTLSAHGIATLSEINKHITLAPRQAIDKVLTDWIKIGKITIVKVEGIKDAFYCLTGLDLDKPSDHQAADRVRILTPFDNSIILRSRLSNIFSFDYALECYVTPAKRRFGYWNCPILWNNNIVGIMDPKADRKTKELTINSIYIDKKVWQQKSFQTAFAKELDSFSRFNGCNEVKLPKPISI